MFKNWFTIRWPEILPQYNYTEHAQDIMVNALFGIKYLNSLMHLPGNIEIIQIIQEHPNTRTAVLMIIC